MKVTVFVLTVAATLTLGSTTTAAGPLNCSYKPVYAPGPPELDPDGDGIWFEEGKGIAQTGPIIGFTQTCEGVESEEVQP